MRNPNVGFSASNTITNKMSSGMNTIYSANSSKEGRNPNILESRPTAFANNKKHRGSTIRCGSLGSAQQSDALRVRRSLCRWKIQACLYLLSQLASKPVKLVKEPLNEGGESVNQNKGFYVKQESSDAGFLGIQFGRRKEGRKGLVFMNWSNEKCRRAIRRNRRRARNQPRKRRRPIEWKGSREVDTRRIPTRKRQGISSQLKWIGIIIIMSWWMQGVDAGSFEIVTINAGKNIRNNKSRLKRLQRNLEKRSEK